MPAKTRRKPAKKRTARTHKPEGMTLEQWQIALRREFGREQKFKLENLDGAAIFSDFLVTNPGTKRTYRVSIRGQNPGDNHCSCPDFAVNTLGTCKHAPPMPADIYGQLFSTVIGLGKSLLENLSQAAVPGAATQRSTTNLGVPWAVEVDQSTGKPCLKIPMPSADMLGQANVWLQALAGAFGRK